MSARPTRLLVAARVLVVGAAVLSLAPLGRYATGWAEYAEVVGKPLTRTPARGYTGVLWADAEPGRGTPGVAPSVTARVVVPRSPADDADVRAGDRLATVDAEPVARASDAEARTERALGTVQALGIVRDDSLRVNIDVPVARYPTFLYPRSRVLWRGAAWAFALVAFLHLLALLTVWPLARRGGRARRVAGIIAAALLWVGGNLARIVWVSTEGAPGAGSALSSGLFDALTLVALAGWVVFPALLLRQSVLASRRVHRAAGGLLPVVFAPTVVYAGGLAVAIVFGHAGPLPPDALVAPVLFYVCVYVAAATMLALWAPRTAEPDDAPPPRWYRAATLAALGLASAGAVFAWDAGPAGDADPAGAWFVTALQLVSLLPVALVSIATLRYGRFEAVLVRGAAYALGLGAAFVVVAGGAAVLEVLVPGGAGPVALGALVVGVLVVAERLAPTLRRRVARASVRLFESDRGRVLRRLDAFGERIRFLVDPEALADAAAQAVGEAFEPRSAVVFLRAGLGGPDERWTSATFRPEPPHFTQADLDRVWDRIRDGGLVWARSDELCEADLPAADAERLRTVGVALAVPVASGHGTPAGLIALGGLAPDATSRRVAVYTTDDVARLRALGVQLALAAERLALIERETTLVRQTAEAELVALRAQINPHFLFNALNTVAALIAEQPDEAEATVESLAGLFRDVLTASGKPEVPLRDELRLVTRYLDVEQARFGDALRVSIDAAPETLDRLVPAFAVQTLVENAVKHGVERRRGGGAVRIDADVDLSGALVVCVADTGVGIPALFSAAATSGDGASGDAEAVHGVGLGNVAARLRRVYGSSDGLRLASSPAGTVATLTLPRV